jgi:hypothetical protein
MLEAFLLIIGGLAVIALALLYGAFAWAFVMYKFWYWFLLPVFTTLPQVTLVQCVGLMMFIGLFNTAIPYIPKKEYRDDSSRSWAVFLAPPVVLLLGWLVKIVIVH